MFEPILTKNVGKPGSERIEAYLANGDTRLSERLWVSTSPLISSTWSGPLA